MKYRGDTCCIDSFIHPRYIIYYDAIFLTAKRIIIDQYTRKICNIQRDNHNIKTFDLNQQHLVVQGRARHLHTSSRFIFSRYIKLSILFTLTLSGGYHVLACFWRSAANKLLFARFNICMLVQGIFCFAIFRCFPGILKLEFPSMV